MVVEELDRTRVTSHIIMWQTRMEGMTVNIARWQQVNQTQLRLSVERGLLFDDGDLPQAPSVTRPLSDIDLWRH